MCRVGVRSPNGSGTGGDADLTDAVFTALPEDGAEELHENAPCGYVSSPMDGTVARNRCWT
jgi:sigma-B regulation protein RsbU (phosphoserine phosphatase)